MAPALQVCPPVATCEEKNEAPTPVRRLRKKGPEVKLELPQCFAEDFWMSPTTAGMPSVPQLRELLKKGQAKASGKSVEELVEASKEKWLRRLKMGFSLLFEGMGSKWRLLESFAEALKERCDVACLDAYDPSASLPSFLRQLLAAEGLHRGFASLEALTAAVRHTRAQPLLLVVHNLEALAPLHQAQLSQLAKEREIYLAASVDHFWAPLGWSSGMLKDFNFCREEIHTMESYAKELSGRFAEPPSWCDPFSVEVTSKVSMGLVLKSLTNGHRELVEVMAKEQLEGRKEGISMPDLLVVAEERMIANNLTKLRRMLNELLDHDIVAQRPSALGTTVYSVLAKEPLLRRLARGEAPEADEEP